MRSLPFLNQRCIPVLVLIWLCLKATTATAGDNKDTLDIPFGNIAVRCYLNNGTWDILFRGKRVITGAYAIYREGEKEITSKELGRGVYRLSPQHFSPQYK